MTERNRAEVYRIYVTDCLRLIGHIEAERYIDLVDGNNEPELVPAEIVTKIRGKLAG